MNPKRQLAATPVIKLGNEFKKVKDYLKRIGSFLDVLEFDHLTVSGDVSFGARTVLKGTVIVVVSPGNTTMITDGPVMEARVMFGSLHVTPH